MYHMVLFLSKMLLKIIFLLWMLIYSGLRLLYTYLDQVNNIWVMSGFLPEGGGYEKKIGLPKRPWPKLKLPLVKQITFFQQAKYNLTISLKAAAEITSPYNPQYVPEGN